MATLSRPVVERIARYAIRPLHPLPLGVKRRVTEAMARASVVPAGVAVHRQARAGVPGELLAPDGITGPARLLYLHGGAYCWGSPRTHRNVTATLALRAGLPVFAPDYRLAPEHPAPAALDDALAVYQAMADDADGPIAVAGDSAGGGLALALAMTARDRGMPQPAGLALISPWVDLTLSGESLTANARTDVILTRAELERGVRRYVGALRPEDPLCSPLRGDLAGLPPMLIHAGGGELFLSEGQELARRAKEAGLDAELRVFGGLWHDFHVHAGMLREADEALAEMGAWLAGRLNPAASPARS